MFSVLLEANELSARENELKIAKNEPETEEAMEVDIKEESDDENLILKAVKNEDEMAKVDMKKLEKLKNLKVTAKFG
jgi:hypothetical protein